MEELGVIRWNGHLLPLVDHPYNTTIRNERAVELAVVFDWLQSQTGDGLEIGNVLAHYGITGHRVVDLHEQAAHVDNLDVFEVRGEYDWIVSISTIEHVHWDDHRNPVGALAAIDHLLWMLRPGGQLLVTIPLGWNPPLDDRLPLDADSHSCWERVDGGWLECDTTPVRYGPDWANKVWIGLWDTSTSDAEGSQ